SLRLNRSCDIAFGDLNDLPQRLIEVRVSTLHLGSVTHQSLHHTFSSQSGAVALEDIGCAQGRRRESHTRVDSATLMADRTTPADRRMPPPPTFNLLLYVTAKSEVEPRLIDYVDLDQCSSASNACFPFAAHSSRARSP